MRRIQMAVAALAILAFVPFAARAQAPCPIASMTPVTKTANYTVTANDICELIIVNSSGSTTMTLPVPSTTVPPGFLVRFKNVGSGTTSITPNSGAFLDGVVTAVSVTQGQSIDALSDGTAWWSLGGIGTTHHP